MNDQEGVVRTYRERAAEHRRDAARLTRACERIAAARVIAFAAGVMTAAAAIAYRGERWPLVIGTTAVAIIFLLLVRYSRRLNARRRRVADLAHVNEQAAFRAEREWSRIDPEDWTSIDEVDTDRRDLDVFGSPSLVQLLPAMSVLGRASVGRWLSAGTTGEEIAARQAAIQELVAAVSFRDEMAAYGMRAHISAAGIARFTAWAGAKAESMSRSIDLASFVLPAATVALLLLQLAGMIARPLWLIGPGMMIALTAWTRRRTRALLSPVSQMSAIAATYADILSLIEHQEFRGGKLSALQARIRTGKHGSARTALRQLAAIGAWTEVRASPMSHIVLQATAMLDWHLARRLNAWRSEFGQFAGEWLGALGEIEGLVAMSALAHANPDWTFPDVEATPRVVLEARQLGHPLLAANARVSNDVVVGPPGTLQLISGSNMSGKSTLLRAVGLNAVLAQAGAPVCAASMCCPLVEIHTSIQVSDSLPQGISYFMAELRRLKSIVDAAERPPGSNTPTVLYLIDEMLRGTNSEERVVAARIVARRLLNGHAIGMITTHDLSILEDAELTPHLQHHHFREVFERSGEHETMRFDYQLHPGPATSRNALRLLALVGLVPSA